MLTSKLKRAKSAMIKINSNMGNLHEAVILARDALLDFQSALPAAPSVAQFSEENQLSGTLRQAINVEETFLKQKSRVNWLNLGDANKKFFFKSCQGRWNSNKIISIADNEGNTLASHKDISTHAVDYFKSLLGRDRDVSPIDVNIELPMISPSHHEFLAASFSRDDVLKTLRRMAKNKSPGPDGFSPEFFISAWSVVGEDVTNAILYFFESLHLPRIINSNAIALVPKFSGAMHMADFRPITCCNTLYKCISKMPIARSKLILPSIISYNQTAFVPKRSIGDNIMLAQALCKDYHTDKGVPRCAFKMDIHKAFDTMNWRFIFRALNRMGFPLKFISWIEKCVSTCMLSVKINGALEGYFCSKAGLRQGDPISPYLFVIGMEVLTAYINHDISQARQFSYHWRTKEIRLSHLIFADDIFLFCRGNSQSVTTLLQSISKFSTVSGLCPNAQKSQCFFCNVPTTIIHETLASSGFQQGSFPIKYLGLPLITGRLKTNDCVPLVHKLCARIESWTVRSLRFSGRLQLLKSVLLGIHGFWSAFLFLPKGVLNTFNLCLSDFCGVGS